MSNGRLSTFEIVHGPHHYWRIRCCSECGVAPHSVQHLFNCSAHPTQLTVQYLWDNPAEVADFLNLDSWRQWTRREELLGYHNNNNNVKRLLNMNSLLKFYTSPKIIPPKQISGYAPAQYCAKQSFIIYWYCSHIYITKTSSMSINQRIIRYGH